MENRLKNLPEWMKGYIGAVIDCEGHVSLHLCKGKFGRRRDMLQPAVGIGMTDFGIMSRIHHTLGVGHLYNEKRDDNRKMMYRYLLRDTFDVWCVLDAIKQYMFVKRQHADILVEYCELKIVGSLTDFDRVRLHNDLKLLNSRPEAEMIQSITDGTPEDPLGGYPE